MVSKLETDDALLQQETLRGLAKLGPRREVLDVLDGFANNSSRDDTLREYAKNLASSLRAKSKNREED
jgi:hypothetical protein